MNDRDAAQLQVRLVELKKKAARTDKKTEKFLVDTERVKAEIDEVVQRADRVSRRLSPGN